MLSTYPTKEDIHYRYADKAIAQQEWERILEYRLKHSTVLPLADQHGTPFRVSILPELQKVISEIDEIGQSELVNHVQNYLNHLGFQDAFEDESYYSSKMEGAYSTRSRAREVVASHNAKNMSEQMILNNHDAMEYIKQIIGKEIDEKDFVKLHKIITKDTLKPEDDSERYRIGQVFIHKHNDDIVYIPPGHDMVPAMMSSLFEFARTSTLHPLIIASILHFYIGFVHPFFDGNGRTARAMMYWYLMSSGYDFFRFFSISSKYDFERSGYYQAFLDSEDETLDVTHFVLMNVTTIHSALQTTIRQAKNHIKKWSVSQYIKQQHISLSKNQDKFLRYAASVEGGLVTLSKSKLAWWPSYDCALEDIRELVDIGLLEEEGRNTYRLKMIIDDYAADTDTISPKKLRGFLFHLIVNDLPSGLDILSTNTHIDSVDSVEMEGVRAAASGDEIEVWGTGCVHVKQQHGSIDDSNREDGTSEANSYVFTYRMRVAGDRVEDYVIEVDTRP